ncbi:MAG: YqgE/AlgH family protein [Deltaproteobacteria bacterium]|jgi:putative transcriptional regulator|nr:YqgE/AlgH family protein [Deltaproteobacteria bacterium]
MESLQGSFLLSTPQMPDPRFREKLIYMCGHTEEGAIGLIVNNPLPDVKLDEILINANIPVPDFELPPVYLGGPVEMSAGFILFSADYQAVNQMIVSETIRLSSDPEILHHIALYNGPSKYLFLLGYAGWGPGQLEYELTDNGWLTLPAEDTIIFDTPDSMKWKVAAQKFGIDITTYGDIIGSA